MTTTAPTFAPSGFTAEDRVAQNILDQLGVMTLMGVGAHEITRYLDAVTFYAKIAKPGQSRARKMMVKITLKSTDLYDLNIGFLDRKTFDWFSLEDHQGLYADQMVEVVRKYR